MKYMRIGKLLSFVALVIALAAAIQAQTFSVLYNFGDVLKDAAAPQYSASLVKFGCKAATFTVNNDKKVTAVVPAGAKSAKITITAGGGIATSPKQFVITP